MGKLRHLQGSLKADRSLEGALRSNASKRDELVSFEADLKRMAERVSAAVSKSVSGDISSVSGEVSKEVSSNIIETIASLKSSLDAIERALDKPELEIPQVDLAPVMAAIRDIDVDMSPVIDAINNIPEPESRKKRWTFNIVRDRDGLIDSITAK